MRTSTLLLAFTTIFIANTFSVVANPSSYYRKIASEQRKLRTKQINYYKTALLYTDVMRLNKGRDAILGQITTAQRNMSRTPAYQGDSAMRNDYMRILNQYQEAYTTMYDSVQNLKIHATESEAALKQYQDAFYHMEFLVDDCEDRWAANEDYFTGAYNVNAVVDPTKNQLNTFRDLALYVEEMRNAYSPATYKVKENLDAVKAGQFEKLEDMRNEMALAAENAMEEATTVGEYQWYDEDDRENLDDYLLRAVKIYLEDIRDIADGQLANELTLFEEARYDGNDKKIEKSKEKIDKILTSLVASENDLNETIERFVTDYAGE